MRYLAIVAGLCLGVLTCSCSSLTSSCDDEVIIPAGLEGLSAEALHRALSCENSVGRSVSTDCGYRLELVRGERKGKNGWGWYSSQYKTYFTATCGFDDGLYVIKIAANPKYYDSRTGEPEIEVGALAHEFLHYLEASNFSEWGHDPVFVGCVPSWNLPPKPPTSFRNLAVEPMGLFEVYPDGSEIPDPSYGTNGVEVRDVPVR